MAEYSFAQLKDTVSIMTYNLMYYREITSFCTSSNNNTSTKDNAMEDIIDYALPDILVVNEMGGGSTVNSFRLLQNALNQNGRSNYALANSTGAGQSLVNMAYFNTDKFVLESQSVVSQDLSGANLVRVIDIYKFRFLDSNLSIHQDTTRIYVISAHLKAGSTSADEIERAKATEAVMAHLDSMNATGNYIIAGDFNLYSSSEPAYQDLVSYINPTLRFFDPINVAGNWHNNGIYSSVHTQSTHTSGGCFASGGMDDRFDFILASDEVMNNTDKMRYIPNTYRAIGQDGNRFNQSIISPTNSSVPSLVSQALYDMSDHLPVTLDLEITLPSATSIQEISQLKKLKFQNPNTGEFIIDFSNQEEKIKQIEIFDLSGKLVYIKNTQLSEYVLIDVSFLPKGTYLLKASSNSYQQRVEKLIKI